MFAITSLRATLALSGCALVLSLMSCGGDGSGGAEGDEPPSAAADERARRQAASPGAGSTNQTFYSEGGKLMRADENIATLGSDLFGDRVNLYNGSLEFVHTDVSLPGNSALPVSVGRRLSTGQVERVQGHFGDWDLEIPRLHGVFAQSLGWTVGAGVATASTARCTNFGQPPQAKGTSNQGSFNAVEYWHGSFLYVPGAGSQELLQPDLSKASVQPTGTLANPKLTTRDRWLVYCGTPLQNGAGEGFSVVAPNGTRYRFDWMVKRLYPGISKPVGTGPAPARTQGPGKAASSPSDGPLFVAPEYLLKRAEVWILPTEVTDRHGNKVTYHYDTGNAWRVTSIRAWVGDTVERKVDFEYEVDTLDPASFRVSRVTDGFREWRYTYRDYYPYGKSLSGVSNPGGGQWALDLGAIATPGPMYGAGGFCEAMSVFTDGPTGAGYAAAGEMTHPSGAKGTFRILPITHGRSQVERRCMGNDWDESGWSYYPLASDVWSIRSKTITGPGLPAADLASLTPGGYTWTYKYGAHAASFAPCNGCQDTKTVTVTDPEGVSTVNTFGIEFRKTEGQLLKVEEGIKDGQPPLRTTVRTYATPTQGPYPERIGTSYQWRTAGDLSTRYTPEKERVVSQEGASFTWRTYGFDKLARPVDTLRVSSLNPGRRERVVFADLPVPNGSPEATFTNRWVLGQVQAVHQLDLGGGSVLREIESHAYDPITLNRQASKSFGRTTHTFMYHADGSLWQRTNDLGKTTSYAKYKRGLAQEVGYADGSNERAEVDNRGLITWVRNAAGTTTQYGYDSAWRLILITPPPEAGFTYYPTELKFERVDQSEDGVPAGHWRQTVVTGGAQTVRIFDALWRPVITRTRDWIAGSETSATVLRRFDSANRGTFESYPKRDIEIGSIFSTPPGVSRSHDSLGRVRLVQQDSELGKLSTETEYGQPFKRTQKNPRGKITVTHFHAYDTPSEDSASLIRLPQGVDVTIDRDEFGKPRFIRRGDASVSVTRRYVYDAHQRLCKTIEPETGATVQWLDSANNVLWRASGLNLPATENCDFSAVPEASKISYQYDFRDRLISTNYGDGSPGIGRSYTPDGLPLQIWHNNALWTYRYNNRRLLTEEEQSYGQTSGYRLTWGVDRNGHIASITYPGGAQVALSPNALGQPTQVSGFASEVKHHPNGALARFRLANGIEHVLDQNVRGLPSLMQAVGVLQDRYTYDQNGNPTLIADEQGGASTRSMGYDDLDRLKTANGSAWGIASYDYDAVDNIVYSRVGGRQTTHEIDRATNQLRALRGATTVPIDYNAVGNVVRRGSEVYNFDLGNRLTGVPGKVNFYSYDGLGRRVGASYTNGDWKHQVYSQSGPLMYAKHSRLGDTNYIYLAGKLIAEFNPQTGVKTYSHTDALGSPVARTDSAGQLIGERTRYEPYGNTFAGTSPAGIGFTGHVNDGETGLVYMQQRYYDPVAGRFLSVDSVVTDANTGENFGRYLYANNNPFRYVDPDGNNAELSCSGGVWCDVSGSVSSAASRAASMVDSLITGGYGLRVSEAAAAGDWGRASWNVGLGTIHGVMSVVTLGQGAALIGAIRVGAGQGLQVATKGTLPSAGGVVRQFEQAGDKVYYRVFSGDANVGAWLTAVPPRSSAWAKEALALPPGNKATMIQEVLVPNGTLLERSRAVAMPQWGRNRGGAEQFKLLEEIPMRNFGPGKPLQ